MSTSNIFINQEEIKPETDILKEVWKCCIPVQINLAMEELTESEPPRPYFLHIPRNTYFTLVTRSVGDHFKSYVISLVDEMWFESDGIPLKWHYPFGVLYDTYGNGQLPWNITVHFQRFPVESLLRCPSDDIVKWHFSQAIKESNYIKYGNTNIINDLGESDSNSHWAGFKNTDYSKFWSVNIRLFNVYEIRKIPIRIFKSDQQKLITQESFPAFKNEENSELTTLLDLLSHTFPEILIQNENGEFGLTHKIIIQGVEPNLDMGLLWLTCNLSYPDNFLYIILQPPKIDI